MLSAAARTPQLRRAATTALSRSSTRVLRTSAAPRADDQASSTGMKLTFTVPAVAIYQDLPVEMVILPGIDGFFGAMPSHVPTISELKPGVVSIQETAGGPLTKYFVPGGFASIGTDSKLRVSALEAATIDELDVDAVKTGLAQYQAAYASATDDKAKAEAEIGVEVYQAMSYAISEG
mmetsp:Transcript_47656/g.103362  ORF Transcript_47656/g.103362 Transcript_47656/m.103362 type:complete len:178 (+) Transcript_47656:22-555(+)